MLSLVTHKDSNGNTMVTR